MIQYIGINDNNRNSLNQSNTSDSQTTQIAIVIFLKTITAGR